MESAIVVLHVAWPIPQLLLQSDHGRDFERGLLVHSFLHIHVYHRHFSAEDATGYQFVQCRELIVLQTAIGKIAVLPIGMPQISSVVLVDPGTSELIRLSDSERLGCSYDA